MAEDNALRLIHRIIRDRDITLPLEAGVTEDWFEQEDHRRYWSFLVNHYKRHGEVISPAGWRDNFGRKAVDVQDSQSYLLEQLTQYRRHRGVNKALLAASEIADYDHNGAIAILEHAIQTIEANTSTASRDVDLAEDPLARYAAYEERAARGTSMLGIPSGFGTIDEATAGFQPGQLVTIVAEPKAGKSTLALRTATNIHQQGLVPLFQSFEMSNREQRDRHDAMRSGISHARLIRGQLRKHEDRTYRAMLREMDGLHRFVLSDAAEGLTVTAIQAKIAKYRPDIVFVDGVYLMFDEITGERNTAQALTNITRSFKAVAQKADVPVVISTQALQWKMRGGKVRADSIGYSSSFFQDSDVILGLDRPHEDEDDDLTRTLKVVASRNCGYVETELDWDWENSTFAERGLAA